MTYQAPDDPTLRASTDPAMSYGDPNEPMWRAPPARRAGWSAESIVGLIVVLAIVVAALAYANRGTLTAGAPNMSQSAPSTTGQGGPAPR
jgi:hypothetical protein